MTRRKKAFRPHPALFEALLEIVDCEPMISAGTASKKNKVFDFLSTSLQLLATIYNVDCTNANGVCRPPLTFDSPGLGLRGRFGPTHILMASRRSLHHAAERQVRSGNVAPFASRKVLVSLLLRLCLRTSRAAGLARLAVGVAGAESLLVFVFYLCTAASNASHRNSVAVHIPTSPGVHLSGVRTAHFVQ